MNLRSVGELVGRAGCASVGGGGKVAGGGGNVAGGAGVAVGAAHPAKNTITTIDPIARCRNFGLFILDSVRCDCVEPPNVGVTRAERAKHARERRGEAEGASAGARGWAAFTLLELILSYL